MAEPQPDQAKQAELPEDLKFEEALAQLEEIVRKLEGSELSLEDSLAQFGKGAALAKFCEGKLKDTAKQIEVLRQTGPQNAEWTSLDEAEAKSDDEEKNP